MLKQLKENLGLVALIVTLGGGVAGWLGLRDLITNTRPVWFSELVDARNQIDISIQENALADLRDKRWALRRDKRLTEEAIANIRDRRAEIGDTPELVEREVNLKRQLEWIDKGIAEAEAELNARR